MELEIGLALSVLGGLLGVLSFVQSRDKSVEKDAAWERRCGCETGYDPWYAERSGRHQSVFERP